MGNEGSVLEEDYAKELQNKTTFSREDIELLWEKFRHLDTDGNKGISVQEFKKINELNVNPLLERVMAMIGVDEKKEVLFPSLIQCLNIFNSNDHKKKLEYCFKIYDISGNGTISNGELYTVLKKMVGKNLTDQQLQQVVDKTILEADSTGTGAVNFDDFCKILNVDYEKQMEFNFKAEAQKVQKK